MRELHAHPEVVAVGEFGLDYFRDFSPRPAQRRAFEMQLQIAADLAAAGTPTPLFLHQRDAHADFLAVMREFDGRHGPVLVHCSPGTRETRSAERRVGQERVSTCQSRWAPQLQQKKK